MASSYLWNSLVRSFSRLKCAIGRRLFSDCSFLLRNRDNKYLKHCIDNRRTICSYCVMHFRWPTFVAAIAFLVILSVSITGTRGGHHIPLGCIPLSATLVRFRDRLIAAKLTPTLTWVHFIDATEGLTPLSISVLGNRVRHVVSV